MTDTKDFTKTAYLELEAKHKALEQEKNKLEVVLGRHKKAHKSIKDKHKALEQAVKDAIEDMLKRRKSWIEDDAEYDIASGLYEGIEVIKKHTGL